MKYCTILTVLLLNTVAFGQKAANSGKIDQRLKQCLDKTANQTTAGMCDCTNKAGDEWDKQLNADYKLLMAKVSPAAKTKLQDAQRQWILFRDKEIALIQATTGQNEGTMWLPIIANRIMELTRDRALTLEGIMADMTDE